MQYNFLDDNFTVYESVETPKVQLNMPLMNEPLDISDWADRVSSSGTPIVKNNLNRGPKMINDNPEQDFTTIPNPIDNTYTSKNSLNKIQIKHSKGSETLSKIIDEVSNESGYEKLKDPHIKYLLMLQAKRESSFNPSAKSSSSSASGYFQFIDGTRKKYSNISRDEFLKNPKEQVRTAYKYLSDIHNSPSAIKLKEKGYNDSLITALGWWYPKSMDMVLNDKRNFSLGGYSIKKAFEDYG